MMIAGTPFEVERRVSTHVDQIMADVRARFVNVRYDLLKEERGTRRRTHTSIRLGGLRLDHFDSVGGQMAGNCGDYYDIGFAVQGGYHVRQGAREFDNSVGGVGSLHVPGHRFWFSSRPRSKGIIVGLTPELLLRSGRAILGDGFRLPTDLALDLRTPAGHALRRNVGAVFAELLELEKCGLRSLATTSFADLIANLSVASMFPEQFLEAGPRHEASSRTVARAEEMIRATCQEPLSIQDLATSLGVTVRALQLGFRRHLGCTPMQYLLSRRLEMARERMLAPDVMSNVQHVAMSCGFINMSKFSSRYRAMFGELPSETLARGRRR